MTSADIPVVDLTELSSPKKAIADRAAEALLHAFGRYGLVYLRKHGIEPSDLDELYASFLELTSRSEADKSRLGGADIWYQRGWTPPNTEQAVLAAGQPDFKECYFAAPEPFDPVASLQYPEVYAANVWPDDDGGEVLRDRYMAIGHQIHEVGLALLRGAARALGLEPYRFEAAVYGASHVTRALRYLPVTAEQIAANVLWGEEHTDFNLLTLLPGGRFFVDGRAVDPPEDRGGLYLRTRGTAERPSRRVPGRPPEGCLVAQVGQELEVLSDGRFLATPHGIVPPGVPGVARTSLAHFVHLHPNVRVAPLPGLERPGSPYGPPVLAGTWALATLVTIGLAPASAVARLGYRG